MIDGDSRDLGGSGFHEFLSLGTAGSRLLNPSGWGGIHASLDSLETTPAAFRGLTRHLGRVPALNMPAGANPALGHAIGVLLKNAWLQALLRRPAEAARQPGRYNRPTVFVCDEY